MAMSLVGLLVLILVLCLILWAVQMLLGAFSIADPIRTIIYVVVIIVVIIILLNAIGIGPSIRIT